MVCPRCGSDNVSVQVVQESRLVNHRHGVAWWLFIGWWWLPFKWLFLALPALIAKLFFRRKVLEQRTATVGVCQYCGHHWNV